MNIYVTTDDSEMNAFSAYYDAVGRKLARAEIVPILLSAIAPIVSKEKQNLSSHTKSGALVASLAERAGSGDRTGTISVFAAATATTKQLRATWGKSTKQKRGFAEGLKGKRGRTKVFYADFVHQGHRLVRVKNGVARQVDYVKGIPFARDAMEELGDAQADVAEKAVFDHILGE
jgi:hypothetical protein